MPRGPLSVAATNLVIVPSPETAIHRIGYGPNPFLPPPWQIARGSRDLTFGGRFDDPAGRRGISEARRFRTIYCSTIPTAAFGESIASFRAPLASALGGLAEIDDEEPLDAIVNRITDADHRGIVPKSWRQNRLMMSVQLDPEMRFVDLADATTLQYVRDTFAVLGATQGLADIDYSALVGPYRVLTQEIASHFFEHIGEDGQPSFAGLR